MRAITALLAGMLVVGSATVPASDGRARYATDAEWEACIQQAQARLAPQGKCGASNCYDDAGRDLIDICVAKVGYLRHTAAETAELLNEIRQGEISSFALSLLRTYPPGHPVRQAYAKAQARR
jgi:hypothetical protein